jgi:hypothetical protein
MDSSLRARSEAKGEAMQKPHLDCFGPADLAMTRALDESQRYSCWERTEMLQPTKTSHISLLTSASVRPDRRGTRKE